MRTLEGSLSIAGREEGVTEVNGEVDEVEGVGCIGDECIGMDGSEGPDLIGKEIAGDFSGKSLAVRRDDEPNLLAIACAKGSRASD